MIGTVEERMAAVGFWLDSTGGGCTAYARRNGEIVELVTAWDGNEDVAPVALTDLVLIGVYENGQQFDSVGGVYTVADVLAALAHPSDEYALLTLRLYNGFHKEAR